MTPSDDPKATARRFLIVGLPRSGSTYLMTTLNSHRDIYCSGEQFNPHAVVGIGEKNTDPAATLERDTAPLFFLEKFFKSDEARAVKRAGFKFMLGHNIRVLSKLAEYPDIDLIYVWRENRLAQMSSLIKAMQSKRWAQTEPDAYVEEKITAYPRQISHRWHEFATIDFLFSKWLPTLPNRHITFEYRDLFADGFNDRVCDFLGLDTDPNMKSNLVKQSPNAVLERFEDPAPIERYFRKIGYERWFEPEL